MTKFSALGNDVAAMTNCEQSFRQAKCNSMIFSNFKKLDKYFNFNMQIRVVKKAVTYALFAADTNVDCLENLS